MDFVGHKTEVKKSANQWSQGLGEKRCCFTVHKSAVSVNIVEQNHVIADNENVIDTDQNRYKKWVKEPDDIRKRKGANMNRDDANIFFHVFTMNCYLKIPEEKTNWQHQIYR